MALKIILCSSCEAINRVNLDKISNMTAHCGKCQVQLNLEPLLVSITSQKLNKIIKNSELLIFVDVYANWCGPCKIYGPIFEKFSRKMWLKAEFYKLDSEKEQSFSSQYKIKEIPTTLIFNKGELIKSQSGLLNEIQLDEMML